MLLQLFAVPEGGGELVDDGVFLVGQQIAARPDLLVVSFAGHAREHIDAGVGIAPLHICFGDPVARRTLERDAHQIGQRLFVEQQHFFLVGFDRCLLCCFIGFVIPVEPVVGRDGKASVLQPFTKADRVPRVDFAAAAAACHRMPRTGTVKGDIAFLQREHTVVLQQHHAALRNRACKRASVFLQRRNRVSCFGFELHG